jgi:branched-chain amino acid transport system substrate-binding protein
MSMKRLALLIAVFALVVAACDSDGEAESTTEATAPPTTAAPDTTEPAPDTTEAAPDTTVGPPSGEPIIIGAAIDQSQDMAFYNNGANVAAQIMVDRINANGGVLGRPLELVTIDTTLDPDQTKSVALDLIEQGAVMLMVTCDFDFAGPAIQEAVAAGVLAIAPCIGTDRMGPKGLGEAGRIAFSFGNVAQDEGAVLAEFSMEQGWESAVVVKDNLLVYFQDVVDAFDVRFQELGGTVVATEEFTQFDGTIGNVVTAVANADKDVIAISTAFADLPAFVAGLRSLGDDTPIVCSWACDGTFWVPEGLNDFYYNTFASVFGDDPDADVNEFITELTDRGEPPAVGGFVGGAQAIEAFALAIETTGGTDAAAIAEFFEGFQDQELIFGEVSFSAEDHTVFGRPHRMMLFTDSVPALQEIRIATSPANIG